MESTFNHWSRNNCNNYYDCNWNSVILLRKNDVIKAVDKHTKDNGSLDDDISVILEEVEEVNIKNKKENEVYEVIDRVYNGIPEDEGEIE